MLMPHSLRGWPPRGYKPAADHDVGWVLRVSRMEDSKRARAAMRAFSGAMQVGYGRVMLASHKGV